MESAKEKEVFQKTSKNEYLVLGIILKVIADVFLVSEHYSWAFLYHLGLFVYFFLAVIPISGLALIKWSFGSSSNRFIVSVVFFANAFLCYTMYDGQEPGIWNIWAHLSFILWIIMGVCSAITFFVRASK